MNVREVLPIIDLHCDLLSFLQEHPETTEVQPLMGASIPYLQKGGVKLQTLAVYTDVTPQSVHYATEQVAIFKKLIKKGALELFKAETFPSKKTQALLAIENAAGICHENMPLDEGFANFDRYLQEVTQIFYISLTHHTENRFGGGNYSEAGLKPDGKHLLEYLSGKGVAIDLSHASDALAHDILNFSYQKGLKLPIIASHSNFRSLTEHVRNLPMEIALEVVNREGIIGINFLRAYLHPTNADYLIEHLLFGLEHFPDSLCFGADFFYTEDHPDQTRKPFFFPEHQNASVYPQVLSQLRARGITENMLNKLAYQNAFNFLSK